MSSTQATDPRDKLANRLTPELALQFGKLAGSERRNVVITSDRHPSSMMMKQAAIAGIVALGGNAYVLEDVPAPSVPFCGIPYTYHIHISSIVPNGLSGMEIFNPKGAYISSMDIFNMTYREMGLKYPACCAAVQRWSLRRRNARQKRSAPQPLHDHQEWYDGGCL